MTTTANETLADTISRIRGEYTSRRQQEAALGELLDGPDPDFDSIDSARFDLWSEDSDALGELLDALHAATRETRLLLTDDNGATLAVTCPDMETARRVGGAAVWSDGGVSCYVIPPESVPASERLIDLLEKGYSVNWLHDALTNTDGDAEDDADDYTPGVAGVR